MIDFRAGEEIETRASSSACSAGPSPPAASLGIDVALPERNGAERARAALEDGAAVGGRLPRRGRRDRPHLRRPSALPRV